MKIRFLLMPDYLGAARLTRFCHRTLVAWSVVLLSVAGGLSRAEVIKADICVYGGTASGVVAAQAAAARGKSVVIVEPQSSLGGIVGGGIRIQRDCMYPDDIGGFTKQLLLKDKLLGGGAHERQPELRKLMMETARSAGIRTLLEHRLENAEIEGGRIQRIHLDFAPPLPGGAPAPTSTRKRAVTVEASVFIDASYEGDLMARAGVAYALGRESREQYHESLAGQRHLIDFDISPYVVPNDPNSGLLPMVDPEPYREGAGSRHFIAYNFRPLWVENGTPLLAPSHLDRKKYALALRAMKVGKALGWPSDNYDRQSLISGGIPGRQSDYPDATWAERSAIWSEWIDHVRTLNMLSGSQLQLQTGQYPGNADFPDQLYIRMGRRMVGEYVMTQQDLMHQTEIADSIGLGFYAVDIYPCRLVAHGGKIASEGETFVRVSPGPYQISYRSLTPKRSECRNLLVSVCMSATHVGLASIRMEPTYMVMGESAGVAAALAVDQKKAVQDLDPNMLQDDLRRSGVILEWSGKGYGPGPNYHWSNGPWWTEHPEEYRKRPIRLDPSWTTERG